MKKPVLYILSFCLTMANLCPQAMAGDKANDKTAIIAEVQKILDTEEQIRGKLDTHLIDTLKNMQSTNAGSMTGDLLETSLLRKETRVHDDQNMLSENHLRIEFLNEFISALETTSDPRAESPKVLLELAHKDLLASVENQSETKTWLFGIYLSIAIRDIMEPSENFADFLKNYIVYSSLREPKSPASFMKGRSYIGGAPDQSPGQSKNVAKDAAETPDDSDITETPR